MIGVKNKTASTFDPAAWLAHVSLESVLLAAGACLRVLWFWRHSLWFDEAKTLVLMQAPARELLALIRGLEGIPPLYFMLARAWSGLPLDPVVGLRLLSVFFGIATLLAFWSLSRRLSRAHAPIALALACLSPFWIHLSQDGRAYALYLLEAVGLGLAFSLLGERWTGRRAFAYAAVALAGLYTHICFGFALLAPFLLGLGSGDIRRRRWSWFAIHAAVALAFLPWLPSLRAQMRLAHTSILTEPLNFRNLGLLFATQLIDLPFLELALSRQLFVIGMSAAIAVAVAAALLARREEAEGSRILFAAMNIAIPLFAARLVEALSGRSLAQARYLLFISPYVYLLLAQVLGAIRRRALRNAAFGLFGASMIAYFLCRLAVDPRLDRLSTALRSAGSLEEPVVHLDPFYYPALRYYYLPERRHLLLCADSKDLPWELLPGYPAIVSRSALDSIGRVVVVDPRHAVSPRILSLSTGRELAQYDCR